MSHATTRRLPWDCVPRQAGARGRRAWGEILLVAALIVVGGEKLAGVEVRQDRPRMLITPAEVEPLRTKCRGAGRTMFEAMKRRADGMLGTKARLDNQG